MPTISTHEPEELLAELTALGTLTDETEVFRRLARLDPAFESNINYRYNVNGILVDLGNDRGSNRLLSAAVKRLGILVKNEPCDNYYYQLGNAYMGLGHINAGYSPSIGSLIDCEEFTKARKNFSMVNSNEFSQQAMTHEANILDFYSRNYEAILLYDRILKKNPEFGMAMGNKAIALIYFFNISATGNPELLITARDLLKRLSTCRTPGWWVAWKAFRSLKQMRGFWKPLS